MKDKYSFEISMCSVETKVSDRRQATHAQLRRMIKEETDPETREALQSPAQLPVASRSTRRSSTPLGTRRLSECERPEMGDRIQACRIGTPRCYCLYHDILL